MKYLPLEVKQHQSINLFLKGVTQHNRKFWNASSNYCDYNPVALFAIIKNIAIISTFTLLKIYSYLKDSTGFASFLKAIT